MKTKLIIIGLAALCAGCATHTGVVNISGNDYMIINNDPLGFANACIPEMKIKTIQEANAYAKAHGKEAEYVSMQTSGTIAGFPTVEYRFKLVDPTNTPAK